MLVEHEYYESSVAVGVATYDDQTSTLDEVEALQTRLLEVQTPKEPRECGMPLEGPNIRWLSWRHTNLTANEQIKCWCFLRQHVLRL